MSYALTEDSDDHVLLDEAERQTWYRCPLCEEQVFLRAGKIKVRHFAHRSNTSCGGEGQLHYDAKLRIKEGVKGDKEPIQVMIGSLWDCDRLHYSIVSIDASWGECEPERSLPLADGKRRWIDLGFRIDASWGEGEPDMQDTLFVEIESTHAMEDQKKTQLNKTGIPWIELYADAVLEFTSEPISLSYQKKAPSWSNILRIACQDPGHIVVNPVKERVKRAKEEEEVKRAEQVAKRVFREQNAKRVKKENILSLPSVPIRTIRMQDWDESRSGKMSGQSKSRVFIWGRRLIENRFKQNPKKPYLFQGETKYGIRFIIDLGGNKEFPIRDRWGPQIYPVRPDREKWNPELERNIADEIAGRIRVPIFQSSTEKVKREREKE